MSLWKNLRGPADQDPAGGQREREREQTQAQAPAPKPTPTEVPLPKAPRRTDRTQEGGRTQMANIGKSISIKGDVTGDEDTVIEGRVEGRIELKNHHLTVGP